MSDQLSEFVAARLGEDEALVLSGTAGEGMGSDPRRPPWAHRAPLTLTERCLTQVRARQELLARYRWSAPGTTRRLVLRRQVLLVAGLYESHPGYDRGWLP